MRIVLFALILCLFACGKVDRTEVDLDSAKYLCPDENMIYSDTGCRCPENTYWLFNSACETLDTTYYKAELKGTPFSCLETGIIQFPNYTSPRVSSPSFYLMFVPFSEETTFSTSLGMSEYINDGVTESIYDDYFSIFTPQFDTVCGTGANMSKIIARRELSNRKQVSVFFELTDWYDRNRKDTFTLYFDRIEAK